MNRRGRCIKAWGLTGFTTNIKSRAMERLAQHLKSELGRDVLIPCHDPEKQEHCEVCFKNDPGKILCPKSEWNKKSHYTQEFRNASVSDDLTDWMCSTDPGQQSTLDGLVNGFSYWTGYDDGSICDCGTPFVVEWEGGSESVTFRSLKNTEERPGFREGPTIVDEYTGAPRWASINGHVDNDEWEEGSTPEGWGVWDSTTPTESPSACSGKPDISSIFELRFKSRDLGNYVYEWDLVMNDSKNCIFEDTILAWYNGEPIATESRQDEAGDHRWCKAKCDANSECGGWTLNKSNGWCALKRTDQIKEQEKKNFVSGMKKC